MNWTHCAKHKPRKQRTYLFFFGLFLLSKKSKSFCNGIIPLKQHLKIGCANRKDLVGMDDNHEIVLFIKELRRLLQDYQKYDNELYKEEISKDIILLSTIIYGSKIGISNKRRIFKHRKYKGKQKPIY
ncbi:hypothetical protein ASE51_14980 [Bacillus sp. Root147]|nr:hypothetical protein ASE51_14980 [Bacillus sp. Root147]